MIIPPNRQDQIVEDGRESPRFAEVIEALVEDVNTMDATNAAVAANAVNIAANAAGIAAITAANDAYEVTNVTTDRTYDADSTTTAEVADVLGTLIADLQAAGVIP